MSIFSTFKNHYGQFHKTNTALATFTALCVIGAAVALSAPYWVSSTSMLAPLAAFAATPLGIGILATVAIALIYSAISAISKNNKVSGLKALKIVIKNGEVVLQVTKEVYEEMKKNNQNKDKDGKVVEDEYRVDFGLEGENYCITVDGQFNNDGAIGDTLVLNINSLEVENKEGEFEAVGKEEWNKILGLDKKKEVSTCLGQLVFAEQIAFQQQGK